MTILPGEIRQDGTRCPGCQSLLHVEPLGGGAYMCWFCQKAFDAGTSGTGMATGKPLWEPACEERVRSRMDRCRPRVRVMES